MTSAMKFYIKRKLGEKQKASYILSAYLPTLLIFIVLLLLVFITIIVHSMGLQTSEIVEVLGSGSILSYQKPTTTEAEVFEVKEGQGLGYGTDETLLLNLKGVEEDFFTSRKLKVLSLEGALKEGRSIILSKLQADKLNLKLGDKVVIALYESNKARVRPVYCEITGLYSTGYGEFDLNLAYVPRSLLTEESQYEILLPYGVDNTSLYKELSLEGLIVERYQVLYKGLLDNVLLSVRLINLIVVIIAFVAGFFALNIATEYISRDKKAIKSLYLMGFSNREVTVVYQNLSLSVTMISAFLGGLIGLLLSFLAVKVLGSLNPITFPVLTNYVTNFSIRIPYLSLALIYLALLLVSYFSLYFSLRGVGRGRSLL